MSQSHRGFERLEPRYLLSSMGLTGVDLSAMRTAAASAPPAESQERPAVAAEEQTRELFAPAVIESLDSPDSPDSQSVVSMREPAIDPKIAPVDAPQNVTEQPVSQSEDITATEVKEVAVFEEVEKVEVVTSSNRTFSTESAVVAEVSEPRSTTSTVTTTLTTADIAVNDPVSVASNDVLSTSNRSQTTIDDCIAVDNTQNIVKVKTTPTRVAVRDANTVVLTSSDQLSKDNKEQRSLAETDATVEVKGEGKPTTSDREQTDVSETDGTGTVDKQEPAKDETPARGDAVTEDEQLADANKAMSAVAREQNDSVRTSNGDEAVDDIEAKLHQQAATNDDRSAAAQTTTAAATNDTRVPQRTSNQSDGQDPFAMAADNVLSEEQSDADSRVKASGMLPQAEGALLLVALGKPLTRLAGGDAGADTSNMDSGSPAMRTNFARARRNRRKAAEERDRWHRRGDARNMAWLPPEELPIEILPATIETAENQAQTSRPAAEPIAARLADEVIFSHPDVDDEDDRSERHESRLPALAYAWGGYTFAGGAAMVTLGGTISVLAADRHRRIRSQERRVAPPPPTYTGRTLARV